MYRRLGPTFALGPLEEYLADKRHEQLPLSNYRLAKLLGVGSYAVRYAREHGMGWRTADRYAVRLGTHPCMVWPSWFPDEAEAQAG